MKAADWLRRAALVNPEVVAVDDGREALSFAELDGRTSEVAARLADQGVGSGSSAVLILGEGLEKVVQIHALIRIGVTVTPVERNLPGPEMTRVLATIEPDHVLGPEDGLTGPVVERGVRPDPGTSDPLCRIMTGGSTGTPKAIGLTAANHFTSAVGSAVNLGLESEDRWLCAVPLSHVSGFTILIRSAIYGTGFFLADRFTPELLAGACRDRAVNTASLVPTMLGRILDGGHIPEGLRFALIGGGPVPPDLVLEASAAGIPVVPTYGLTEACSQVATSTPRLALRQPGSAGPALPGAELRIEAGEILVRGPMVSHDAASPDGWLRTGDLGRVDDEGLLFVEGRTDRAILSGGEKVDPVEVESVLASHPEVAEVVVFGAPDPEWQQAVVAAVVPADGCRPSEERLIESCGQELAGFKVPKRVVLMASIPLTGAGKPDLEAMISRVTGSDP